MWASSIELEVYKSSRLQDGQVVAVDSAWWTSAFLA
jgi:hypothetical protein